MESIFLGSEVSGHAETIRASPLLGNACRNWENQTAMRTALPLSYFAVEAKIRCPYKIFQILEQGKLLACTLIS